MANLLTLAFLVLLIPPVYAQDSQDKADSARIEQLVRDLGGDAKTRDEARRQLQGIGKQAIPYLKEAASDKDAERAMAARKLLLEMLGKDAKAGESTPDVRVIYKDWSKGIEFLREESGRIKLTVPEQESPASKRTFKTYEADSLEDFKKRYPEIAKTYEVEKLASPESLSKDAMAEWRRLRERLGLDADGDRGNMEDWIERQQREMERHLRGWDQDGSLRPGKELGILVSPVPSALRDQLGLKEHEGLLVHRIQSGSLAEKSGVRPNDILLRLEGRDIKDVQTFRKDLEKALSTDHFTLEAMRGGKNKTLEVTPKPSKPAK
jgi:hypothetical protein